MMHDAAVPVCDIVIPVFNEGENIIPVLSALRRSVRMRYRVLVAYDFEEDTTVAALRAHGLIDDQVVLVKNTGRGPFQAVVTGFMASTAPAVIVFPADDDYNAAKLDVMYARFKDGCDVVAASRFMRGGRMVGCPWLKAVLVRSSAAILHHVARVPTHDPSNGFRLFSRRALSRIPLESTLGFTYSIEILVKCHRLGWPICEVPVEWIERTRGRSRFKVLGWLPAYFRWFRYAFATTYLRRPASSVRVRP
jgi:glycosyltransferase involved in cell wall biosynthesis